MEREIFEKLKLELNTNKSNLIEKKSRKTKILLIIQLLI
jgi:hypothetical protein